MSRPRNLESLLNGSMGRIVDRAKALGRLEQRVLGYLDDNLARHCRLANINGSVLVLQVDSPAWAGRLRQQVPRLLVRLQKSEDLAALEHIRVTVHPMERRLAPPPTRAHLSAQSAAEIEAAAETIGDEALSAALKRLAKRHN